MSQPVLLPMFLKLDTRKVLVVGGGPAAAAKLALLQGSGACVTVVARTVCAEIAQAAFEKRVSLQRRGFEPDDVRGAWLVFAAATSGVNRAVAAAASERCVFVQATGDPAPASACAGGVIRRGGVTVAISTAGRALALAAILREAIESLLPEELTEWISLAGTVRKAQDVARPELGERRPAHFDALAAGASR